MAAHVARGAQRWNRAVRQQPARRLQNSLAAAGALSSNFLFFGVAGL